MAQKFYAVRKGHKSGIYETWAECKAQVIGFSGAVYKSFLTLNEAKQYMEIGTKREVEDEMNKSNPLNSVNVDSCQAVAYVDGSYDLKTKRFSCGVVMFHEDKEHHLSESYDNAELAEMRNVAGEIKGAEKAMQFCLERDIKSLNIYHDYEGVAKWCTGEWQAKKAGTKAYKSFYNLASQKIQIQFIKVKGHSGDKYNELADQLAKKALGII